MTLQPERDLGCLEAPLLIFGGAYSNLQATQALYQFAQRRGIPPSQVICTGDLVAYCAQPQACVDLIRDWGIAVLMGNCEESLGFGADDCGCGFAEGSQCDLLSNAWYPYATQRLNGSSRAWMRALPRVIRFRFSGCTVAVVHGGGRSINRFLYPSMQPSLFAEEMDLLNTDIVLAGHCGLPFVRSVDRRLWLNAGAIGMPANDATTDGWFLLLEGRDGGLHYHAQRLEYDAQAASAAMKREGLNTPYADALVTGLWPSTQVLPTEEVRQTGISLQPFAGTFSQSL